MNIKKIKLVSSFLVLLVALTNCTSTGQFKKSKPFKHNTPLIKENIKKSGQTEIAKTLEMGPKPIFGDTTKLNKRKQISKIVQKVINDRVNAREEAKKAIEKVLS